MEPRKHDRADDDGPSRRSLVVAAILVITLVVGGGLVAQGLLDMSKLQDCAVSGRNDC